MRAPPAVRKAVKTGLSFRNDTMNDLFLLPKNKNVKMLWSLPMLKSRILDLIWQRTAYFVQSDATMFDPSWIQKSKREMPNANDPFLVLNWRYKLLTLIFQLFPHFSHSFCSYKSFFLVIQCYLKCLPVVCKDWASEIDSRLVFFCIIKIHLISLTKYSSMINGLVTWIKSI